ncbi:MAG: hypothetical protein HY843_03910 [Bdellovibrio sp.]|nr:hypothetical protein [Bdellovibrio sp.]
MKKKDNLPVLGILLITFIFTANCNKERQQSQPPPMMPPDYGNGNDPYKPDPVGAVPPGNNATAAEHVAAAERELALARGLLGGTPAGGNMPYGQAILGKNASEDTSKAQLTPYDKKTEDLLKKGLTPDKSEKSSSVGGTGVADTGSQGNSFSPSLGGEKTGENPLAQQNKLLAAKSPVEASGTYSGGGGGGGSGHNSSETDLGGGAISAASNNQDYDANRVPAQTQDKTAVMLSEDPEDYLSRINQHANLFKQVEKKYTEKASLWALQEVKTAVARHK